MVAFPAPLKKVAPHMLQRVSSFGRRGSRRGKRDEPWDDDPTQEGIDETPDSSGTRNHSVAAGAAGSSIGFMKQIARSTSFRRRRQRGGGSCSSQSDDGDDANAVHAGASS